MHDTVLVLSEFGDAHADSVIMELHARGVPVFRFHTDEFPRDASVSVELRGPLVTGEIRTAHRTVALDRIMSIWYRRPRPPEPSPLLDAGAVEYAVTQANDALKTLWVSLDVRWVGHPLHLRSAEIKALQLRRAHEMGLRTPPTLVSNHPPDVGAFIERLGESSCAVKPLHLVGVTAHDGYHFPLTALLDRGQPLDAVALAPSVFQPYIEKELELRCVVIGDEVFTAGIRSQDDPTTKVDWRNGDNQLTTFDLAAEVERSLVELVRSFGLNFSSVDLIVTPDGDIVFLELNPNGQWLWIERELGFPLTARLADLLVAGNPRDGRREGACA